MSDPFTLVYDGLWDLLEASSSFTALVAEKNRIKFTTTDGLIRRPDKDSLTESDIPEVMIYPGPMRFADHRDSSGQSINRIYSVLVTSGERILDAGGSGKFFPVQWEIARALINFDDILDLTYEATKFVHKIEQLPTVEGMDDSTLNRDLKGWSAVWQADVQMWFTNTILAGG